MLKNISIFLLILFIITSCNKKEIEINQGPNNFLFAVNTLDSFSAINKTTSWYNTVKGMNKLFPVYQSLYWSFEEKPDGSLIPFNSIGTNAVWSPDKTYYANDLGTYLYYDFTGDGKKDLWAAYLKNPWPTNANGLHLFSEYMVNPMIYDVKKGLTQVRKCVISEMDNDKNPDIVLFSSGYDAFPNPGDSLAIFYPKDLKYQYLSQDIGYFHGGATGDINGDGLTDIVAYSGGSAAIPLHPTCYINKGNRNYELNKSIFQNFALPGNSDNYYTVELFDINKDNKLDLFLGSIKTLKIIFNTNGIFDRNVSYDFQVEPNLELMDVAFFDFNFDGNMDVLTMSNKNTYQGWGLRLYINNGGSFVEKTKDYFDVIDGFGNSAWIKWIRIFDYDEDGDLDIVGDGLFGELKGTEGRNIYWQNNSGKFKYIYK